MLAGIASMAQEKMTFMPSWLPQAQFTGYYVALEKGFFADEGLDVTIEHIGVNSSKPGIDRLEEGEVDIIVSHPIQALLARDRGLKVKSVLQVNQTTAMMIVSRKKLDGPKSLNGLRIGRWKTGFSEICEVCCLSNGLEVEWVPFLNGINLFISGAIDATVCMSYNEYYALLEAVGDIPPEYTITFRDCGYDIPEDGLYVTEDYLAKHGDAVDKFCRATKKGWDWSIEHPDEALDIVMDYVAKCGVKTNRYHQKLMMEGIFELLVDHIYGEVDYEPIPQDVFDSLVKSLLQLGYIKNPVTYNEFVR